MCPLMLLSDIAEGNPPSKQGANKQTKKRKRKNRSTRKSSSAAAHTCVIRHSAIHSLLGGHDELELTITRSRHMRSKLQELPVDALPAIARCLTGADLFDLARVNRWSWRHFSQDVYWRDRLTPEDAVATNTDTNERGRERERTVPALQLYMRAFSYKFRGLPTRVKGRQRRRSSAQVTVFDDKIARKPPPFTFDVWFCLLDSDGGGSNNKHEVFIGGILLGAQCIWQGDHTWSGDHQQFAFVSSDLKLYCSVVNQKPEIASNLELNRWYHLALTYGKMTQRVYLDGQLVSNMMGDLQRRWWFMNHYQIGTGWITAGDQNTPRPNYSGWYPFNGLIDNFRWWKRGLSEKEILDLATGSAAKTLQREALYSLKRDLIYCAPKHTSQVGCSRPKEKVADLLSRSEHSPRSGGKRRLSLTSRHPGRFRHSVKRVMNSIRCRTL